MLMSVILEFTTVTLTVHVLTPLEVLVAPVKLDSLVMESCVTVSGLR